MRRLICLTAWLPFAALAQAPDYDLILKGGHVIDPKNNVDAVRDVAIRGSRIAAVAPDLPAASAKKVIDVAGFHVTPGLVDIHAHVFADAHGTSVAGGPSSVFPDHIGFRTGVTTMVDVGSSGWRNSPSSAGRSSISLRPEFWPC